MYNPKNTWKTSYVQECPKWQKYVDENVDRQNPYGVLIRNPDALNALPDNLKKELEEENPPPSPVMEPSGKKYKPYKDVFKTELTKAPPVLPKAPKSPGIPDKKLHPGFQMSLDKVRVFAKCNECGKPRVVYSKLKLG